jgi:hypothetical protein
VSTRGPIQPTISIAYIVSAYQLPEQLGRLVHSLDTAGSSFLLHVDKKADANVFRNVFAGLGHLSNTYFLKRHTCYWGGFGHVAATLEGIRTLLKLRIPFDYLVLLTGQDYPIKSNGYISRFLGRHYRMYFVDHIPLPHHDWENSGKDREQLWLLRVLHRHVRILPPCGLLRRRVPTDMSLFGGSSYWCITRQCAEYIHAFVAEHPDYARFFKYVDVPDELFFQTILINSPLRDTIVNDDLRHIVWRDPSAGSPAVLTEVDFAGLASSSKLFARKFDTRVDKRVLDRIDGELLAVP